MSFQAVMKQQNDKHVIKYHNNDFLHKSINSSNQNQIIQRKSTCPCGGGCPRCVQTKLKISQPGDIYEKEADRIADQVVNMSDKKVQRKCSACEIEEEKEMKIHRKVSGFEVSDEITNEIHSIRESGSPLDMSTRNFMESRFGVDFGNIRIHTDEKAVRSAKFVNALAYTVGNDIVFGREQYAPKTEWGQKLLAHELTHVIQQGGVEEASGITSHSSGPFEQTADKTVETEINPPELTKRGEIQVGSILFRRVAGVNCTANEFGAPDEPRTALETADRIALDLATQTGNDLAMDSQTVLRGIPPDPSTSLQAYENHFGLPVAVGGGFLNRLTGAIRATQEQALSEELMIVSRRFSLVSRLMNQGLSYNCPENRSLSLVGCTPTTCADGDAFSCPGNSLVGLCSTFWTEYDDNARAQIMIHEALHIAFGNMTGLGSILDATTRGAGRNFNIAGCYEALLSDLTGADSHADCPDVP